jgi:GNAT superfamily N-acetyltransferase
VPFEPFTGEDAWLGSVRRIVPPLAAAFGPDVVVSQHGADSHAWDPLAHLRVTTTAMGAAARLVDEIAHRHAGGRWLSTGGGGYDVYRVVPRAWALTWLAGAHREPPPETPSGWRERWAAEGERYDQSPPPARFHDEPNAGLEHDTGQEAAERQSDARAALVESAFVPALLRIAADRGWWTADGRATAGAANQAPDSAIEPTIRLLERNMDDRLVLAPRTIPPADPGAGLSLLAAAVRDGARVVAAVAGEVIVGVALAAPPGGSSESWTLAAVGVAPSHRRRGVAGALLRELVDGTTESLATRVTVAERDPIEPLPIDQRRSMAARLLAGAGFAVGPVRGPVGDVDAGALEGSLRR